MTDKSKQVKMKFTFGKSTPKAHKWLAKLKSNRTVWFDEWADTFDDCKPYDGAEAVIRLNTTLFIYEEDDVIDECKYIGKTASGGVRIGWKTLQEAIEDYYFDIVEFTERCKNLYLDEVTKND